MKNHVSHESQIMNLQDYVLSYDSYRPQQNGDASS